MDGYIELHPTNRKHRTIRIDELDNFEICSEVVWTIKNW